MTLPFRADDLHKMMQFVLSLVFLSSRSQTTMKLLQSVFLAGCVLVLLPEYGDALFGGWSFNVKCRIPTHNQLLHPLPGYSGKNFDSRKLSTTSLIVDTKINALLLFKLRWLRAVNRESLKLAFGNCTQAALEYTPGTSYCTSTCTCTGSSTMYINSFVLAAIGTHITEK